ncbi:unnamed protein product [Closterium sp. Yama58-4]|nr:unnamed protein product [Closterium sp. Yama58-4]
MRTSALLCGLVLLSALLLAANAVPDGVSPLGSRRALSHSNDDSNYDSSCLGKFKTSQAKCRRNHKCCDFNDSSYDSYQCTRKIDSCEAKAYKKFKACKYGDAKPSSSNSCYDWCKYPSPVPVPQFPATMKTFALLSGLVLLSALLAITSAAEENTVSAFDATPAVPEEGSRRLLTAKASGPTCMEKFKKASKECQKNHKCASDDCTSNTERCLAKAYKHYKDCKYPPPPKPTCKELCKALYDRCIEFHRGSCGGKYNNCIQNNCD